MEEAQRRGEGGKVGGLKEYLQNIFCKDVKL